MDDLFRKAAEQYALRTDSPDWEKVAAGLKEEVEERPVVLPFYRRYLVLIVSALVLVCGGLYVLPELYQTINNQGIAYNNSPDKSPAAGTGSSPQLIENEAQQKNAARRSQLIDNKTQQLNTDKSAPLADDETQKNSSSRELRPDQNVTQGKKVMGPSHPERADAVDASKSRTPTKRGVDESARDKKTKPSGAPDSMSSSPTDIETEHPASIDAGFNNTTTASLYKESQPEPRLEYASVPGVQKMTKGEVTAPFALARSISPGTIFRYKQPFKRFYTGFSGGLDMTSVSLQQSTNPGYHYGLTAGYRFLGRWSVEAGFFVERKKYLTSAEYFDKSRLYINPNSTILSIDGICAMYEIPVSIKYDIVNTYRSGWFVTGGFSSYIMKKEDYSMLYRYNTSNTTAKHDYTYRNSGSSFFSQLRVSGGYIYKLPANYSLRVEPYINAPVGRVGYGKLKLVSAGLNLGVYKDLF